MSSKSESFKVTTYHEILFFSANRSAVKSLKEGVIAVDKKGFYIGEKANWTIRWKDVEVVDFHGRNSLTIKYNDDKKGSTKNANIVRELQCLENSSDDFHAFYTFAQRHWDRAQGKREQSKKGPRGTIVGPTTAPTTKHPAKKRRQYGTSRRTYQKPQMTPLMTQAYYDSSDDDGKNDAITLKKSWTADNTPSPQPLEHDMESVDDDASSSMNAEIPEKNGHSNDDKGKTRIKGKRRLQRKAKGDEQHSDDDDDDDIFDDVAVTTPASKRLVSPANDLEDDTDADNEENEPPVSAVRSPSAKGNQSIMHFFGPADGKIPAKPRSRQAKEKAEQRTTALLSKPMPTTPKKPLKPDHSEWFETTPPPSSVLRKQKFRAPARLKLDDSDVDSIGSSPRRPRPFNMTSELSGSKTRQADDADDPIVEDSPIKSPLHGGTPVVNRSRFWSGKRRRYKSPMTRFSPRKSSADDVLAAPLPSNRTTPKTIRPPINPYAYNNENRKPLDASSPKGPWRGLRNLGNTCYLNASLQMLFTVPTFVSSLAGKGKELAKNIVSVSEDAKDSLAIGAANPNSVKKAIDQVTDKFEGYEQRDAHEFISDLVDRVHDELEEEQKESGTENAEEAPVLATDDFFRMNVQVTLTCDCCGYARTMEEMYRHLSIDVEDENNQLADDSQDEKKASSWSVQKGINQFFAPEKREIKCERCENGMTATQTLRIISRPKALLLHLKRFVLVEKPKLQIRASDLQEGLSNDGEEPKRVTAVEMAIRKNKAPVVLDATVSLGPIVPSDDNKENTDGKDDRMANYDVESVVHHIGGTAWSGHYTCDALRTSASESASRAKWISFDDGMTMATTADTVLMSEKSQKTAYMLLYTLHQ